MLTSLLIHHPNQSNPPPPLHLNPRHSRPNMADFPLPSSLTPGPNTQNPPPYKAATEAPPPAYIPPSRSASPTPPNYTDEEPLITNPSIRSPPSNYRSRSAVRENTCFPPNPSRRSRSQSRSKSRDPRSYNLDPYSIASFSTPLQNSPQQNHNLPPNPPTTSTPPPSHMNQEIGP